MTVYAVNGLGRIGKLILRPLLEYGAEIAFLNDAVGTPEMHAHLLEFDTVHGRWDADFSQDATSITVNGTHLPRSAISKDTSLIFEIVTSSLHLRYNARSTKTYPQGAELCQFTQ